MELTWPIKLRIAITCAVGIFFLGIISWPLVAPSYPLGVISLINGKINAGDIIILSCVAFAISLICYFLSWPYGKQIAVLAVPAGLAIWAYRSGNVASFLQLEPSILNRLRFYSALRWESLLWLCLVIAGLCGVYTASKIHNAQAKIKRKNESQNRGILVFFNIFVAIIGSAIVAQLFIGLFARNFTTSDNANVLAIGQPAVGQIIFAVTAAFIISAFLVKIVLNLDYIWPILSTCLITPFAIIAYGKQDVIKYFAERWPAVFFPNSVLAVLPIQIVAFGSIGAVIGYWLAVQYDYVRQHNIIT